VISHSGGIEGFNTSMAYFPETKVTVVALGNLNGSAPDQIVQQLGAATHGETVVLSSERRQIDLPDEVLAEYEGTYPISPNFSLTITLEDGALISRAEGQPDVPLYAEAKDKFFTRTIDAQIEFERGDDGKVAALVLRQGTNAARAGRQ
jgi:hypothetical protein